MCAVYTPYYLLVNYYLIVILPQALKKERAFI